MTISKIATRNLTEAIAKAMEQADRIKRVIIIYETKDDEPTSHGVIMPGDMTLAEANYLLDMAKRWALDG